MDYYVLSPIMDKSLNIQIPTNSSFVRPIITKERVDEIIKIIPKIEIIKSDSKKLENEYKQLMQNGTHEDLIKIIKTTYLRNKERLENKKKISDKDNNYFNKAEKILYNEFSIALDMTCDETKKYIIDKVSSMEK